MISIKNATNTVQCVVYVTNADSQLHELLEMTNGRNFSIFATCAPVGELVLYIFLKNTDCATKIKK